MSDSDPKREPKLYAFSCGTNDPEDARNIFAPSHARAMREFLSQSLNGNSPEVSRKPSYDEYAPGPVPAMTLLEEGWYYECSGCSRRIAFDEPSFENTSDEELRRIAERNAEVRRDMAAFLAENPEPPKVDEALPHPEKWKLRNDREAWHKQRYLIEIHRIDPPLSRVSIRIHGDTVFCDHVCQMKHVDQVADINLSHADAEKEAARRWPGAPSYASKRYPYTEPNVVFRPEGFESDVVWRVKEDENLMIPADMPRWNSLYGVADDGETGNGEGQDDQ